jgi:hypothetical protein
VYPKRGLICKASVNIHRVRERFKAYRDGHIKAQVAATEEYLYQKLYVMLAAKGLHSSAAKADGCTASKAKLLELVLVPEG